MLHVVHLLVPLSTLKCIHALQICLKGYKVGGALEGGALELGMMHMLTLGMVQLHTASMYNFHLVLKCSGSLVVLGQRAARGRSDEQTAWQRL
jgi:hypothetical protein